MMREKIVIIGAGAIGTALGNAIASDNEYEVTLLSIEEDVVKSINETHRNFRYFPYIELNPSLKANLKTNILKDANYVFLATPSSVTINYLQEIRKDLNPEALLINLAKGFGNNQKTIAELLQNNFDNPVGSFKGPTFARELLDKSPTAFTFACENEAWFQPIDRVFRNTVIDCDFTTDVKGVEFISILKNIYAIVMGIIDARFNSPNLRFMILTKTMKEMRNILIQFGGREETLFNYCGFGDFAMTSLNDLSRNRTLGLFIGKGFFTRDISEKVLLEGKLATSIFCEKISKSNKIENFQIINELYKVFNYDKSVTAFTDKIINHIEI